MKDIFEIQIFDQIKNAALIESNDNLTVSILVNMVHFEEFLIPTSTGIFESTKQWMDDYFPVIVLPFGSFVL